MPDKFYAYNGKLISPSAGKVIGKPAQPDPYNPLGLPPFTIRAKFSSGFMPTMGDTQTLVDAVENVWDIYKNSTNWWNFFVDDDTWEGYPVVSVLGANTTGVEDMSGMFLNCSSLSSVALFDTSSCTCMDEMFSECTSLTTVPLYDTSSCTDMGDMFSGCTSLSAVPLLDTSACTTMSNMFNSCTSLTAVPLLDTSACTMMSYMFSDCTSLITVPLFDTSSCTSLNSAFYGCTSLSAVPLFDTSSCTFMDDAFNGCTSLTAIPLFDTSSCLRMPRMFSGCTSVQSGALALYQQASTQANPPVIYANCFYDCGSNTTTGAAELAQIPTSWGGTMA